MLTLRRINGTPTFPVTSFPSLARAFDDFFEGTGLPAAPAPESMPLDISETDQELIVRASVPGFSREQISVEVHDGVLTIGATRTEEVEKSTERYFRRERSQSSATRRLALPRGLVTDQVSAELRDGVLTLRVPKVQAPQPQKIEIR